MRIENDEIVYDNHDYTITYSGGYKQRTLTPAALERQRQLRLELKARQETQKKADVAELARKLRAERAEKARLEKEARQKAFEARQAETRAKVENGIRERVLTANPGIRPDELERTVARMLEDHFVEETRRAAELAHRQVMAGWNEA